MAELADGVSAMMAILECSLFSVGRAAARGNREQTEMERQIPTGRKRTEQTRRTDRIQDRSQGREQMTEDRVEPRTVVAARPREDGTNYHGANIEPVR